MVKGLNERINHKKWVCDLLRFIFLFGMEFDIALYGMITLRKIVFAAAAMAYLFRKGSGISIIRFSRRYIYFTIWSVLLSGYVWLVNYMNSGNRMIDGNAGYRTAVIFIQYMYFLIFPFMISSVFQEIDEFLNIQLYVILFQSCIAIIGRMSQKFRLFIFYAFNPESENMYENVLGGARVCIIGNSGSAASWILFSGCLICCYFFLSKTNPGKYAAYYGLLTISMVFVGRTGLYFSMLLLAGMILYALLKRKAKLFLIVSGIVFLGLLSAAIYIIFVPDSYLKNFTVQWAGEIFIKGAGEGSTIDIIRNMKIPPLSAETIFGTGIVDGVTRYGLKVHSDIGYIQTFTALGLTGAVYYYLCFMGFAMSETHHICNRNIKRICIIFILFMMIAEIKEPYLRKTPNALILMAIIFVCSAKEKQFRRQKTGERICQKTLHF